MDNIMLAHQNARKGKTHYKEVRMVDNNKELYFKKLQEMLINKTFKNSPYTVFTKTFRDKTREIYKLPYFPDRILHHCIMQVLEPLWKKTFIKDTYASIKGRGIHPALKRMKSLLKKYPQHTHCLKLDIQKYYPSVNNNILKQLLRKKIKCQNTLQLLDEIIDSAKGIPIGNYLSQYFGNIYLTYFDHFVKEKLKIKTYCRYCDDIVIVDTKYRARSVLKTIIQYLHTLKLKIKHNFQIFQLTRGIDFLGYRIFPHFCLVRKSIINQFKKAYARKQYTSYPSYHGWFIHANTYTFLKKYPLIP